MKKILFAVYLCLASASVLFAGAWTTPNNLSVSGSGSSGGGSGTITGVTAGTGLSGGGTSGNVEVDLDYTAPGVWSGAQTYTASVTYTSTVTHNQIGVPTWTTQQNNFIWKMGASSTTVFEVDLTSTSNAGKLLTGFRFQGREEWNNADSAGSSNNAYYSAVATAPFYGKPAFAASVSTATNIVYLNWFSGDFDTAQVPTAYLADFQGGVDTSSRSYIVSIASVTAGDLTSSLNFANLTRFVVPNVATGGTGRSGQSAVVTLTSWNSFIVANKHYVIAVAREGDSTVFDPSAVTSYYDKLYMVYGRTQ